MIKNTTRRDAAAVNYSTAPRPRADRLTDEPTERRDPSQSSLEKIIEIEARAREPLPQSSSRAAQLRACAAAIRAMRSPEPPPVPRRTVRFRSDIAPPVPRAAVSRPESEPRTVRQPRIVHDHRLNVARREAAENARLEQAAAEVQALRERAHGAAMNEAQADLEAAREYEAWLDEVSAADREKTSAWLDYLEDQHRTLEAEGQLCAQQHADDSAFAFALASIAARYQDGAL